MKRQIFHLSVPVADLAAAKHFYVSVLGASTGRHAEEWLDILLWGHQITLQHRPADVVSLEKQGKRHFGVVLPWSDWEREAERIKGLGAPFLEEPSVLKRGTDHEQGKFYLADPSNNVIEVKTCRNVEHTLGLNDA